MNSKARSSVRLISPVVAAIAIALGGGSARVAAETHGGPCASATQTRASPTREVHHGVTVEDPYRWLEDDATPAVRTWSEAQSACARRYLDALPGAAKIRTRLTELLTVARGTTYDSPQLGGRRLFMLQSRPDMQQPSLVWFESERISDTPRLALDLMRLDPSGGTVIDWYVPSGDGRLVAVSLSQGGSERGTLHVFDAETGRRIDDTPIENVNNATAGGDLVWAPHGKGFFYTRYPQRNERPQSELAFHQRVYYHRIGTAPADDRLELGAELPPIASIRLRMQRESGRVIAWVQNGDSGQFRFFLRETTGRWRPFGNFGEGHLEAEFGREDDIYLLTTQAAPRGRVLRLSARDLDLSRAQTIISERDAALTHSFYSNSSPTLSVSGDRLLLVYQAGGPTQLRVFSTSGEPQPVAQLPEISQVSSVTPLQDNEVLFAVQSFVMPRVWHKLDLRKQAITPVLADTKGAKPWNDVAVMREFATSRDGTRVPVTIVRMRDTKTRGALLTGYGGYRMAVAPQFEPELRLLLQQGIAYAVANLRGGSEFGEEWHSQGSLTQKQNVFDDFIAVGEHLFDRGHAPRGKLAITGTSNGGLLMGAIITQRPQLAQAVVAKVGVYDSLRNELDANGAFNIPEFGTVKDEQQFRALRAYSPYHNVRDGERYPPTLFMTGANDSRVDPMHSRKMLARLQSASRSDAPLLLRTSDSTGHGAGTPLSAHIGELTDMYAFILHALELPYREAAAATKKSSKPSSSTR